MLAIAPILRCDALLWLDRTEFIDGDDLCNGPVMVPAAIDLS